MQRIGIFGGSFNPIHWGHLLIAETAREQAHLDQVLWLPTYNPPYKAQILASFDHRYHMVYEAIADHPAFRVSKIEAQRAGKSYALMTFLELHHLYPTTEWFWILGIDAFQNLPHWHGDRQLAAHITWLVAPRPPLLSSTSGQQIALQMANQGILLKWQMLPPLAIDLSSSAIRDRCQRGQSIRYRVPEPVRHYIFQQKLYRTS